MDSGNGPHKAYECLTTTLILDVALAAPSLQSFSSGNHLDSFDFANFDAERTVNSRPVRQQALSLVPFTINDPVPSNARRSIPTYYAEEIQDNEASSRFAGMASNSVQSVFNGNANEANEEANIYDENNDVSPIPNVHDSVGIKNFSEVNEYDEDEGMATVFPHDPHALPELCALQEERGSCFGNHLRWFYDSEIGKCSSFMYSGCGNNANHFTSLETCERACGEYREQRVCELPSETGNCTTTDHVSASTILVSKWFFDHRLGQCHVFMWSGCGGNGNRFSSKSECENLCRGEALEQPDDSVCSLVRDSGPCFDQVTLWYFESPVQECRKFTYGGCRGNGNRFNTKDECEKRCKSPTPSKTDKGNMDSKQICSMSFESGPCRGTYKRYFFDANVGHCKMFSYGGCEGNANRFKTEIECYNTCKAFANQSLDNGNKLHQPHHYQRARVETQPGPFSAESTIQLRCIADSENDASEPTWYLNEVEIDFHDPTTLSRLNLSKNGQFLVIPNAKPKHNGDYSCAIGSLGMISKPYSLVVQELPMSLHCTDKGSHSTCSLIKKTGLCSNLRYGKFCCRTCTNTSPVA